MNTSVLNQEMEAIKNACQILRNHPEMTNLQTAVNKEYSESQNTQRELFNAALKDLPNNPKFNYAGKKGEINGAGIQFLIDAGYLPAERFSPDFFRDFNSSNAPDREDAKGYFDFIVKETYPLEKTPRKGENACPALLGEMPSQTVPGYQPGIPSGKKR